MLNNLLCSNLGGVGDFQLVSSSYGFGEGVGESSRPLSFSTVVRSEIVLDKLSELSI